MKTPENYFKLITYIVVIVLINAAGVTLFYRLDLTKNKVYSISDASKEVVKTLTEPLTIKVFFTKNLPAPHNNTERYLKDLLEEYAINSNKYFNYSFYDVSPEEEGMAKDTKENQEIAKNYGIHPVQIRVIEKDEIKFKKAYMGLVMIHGDIIERIPTITSTEGLEYKLTTAIQKLNNKISALLSIEDKIHIDLYLSSSLNSVAKYMGLKNLDEIPEKMPGVVEKLNSKNYGKLAYQHLDPTVDPKLDAKVAEYNVMSVKWPDIPKKNIKAGQGAIGIVMRYGEKTKMIPIMQVIQIPIFGTQYNLVDPGDLEEVMNENLETLIDINEDIGYLADHGTMKLNGGSPMMGMQQQNDSLNNFRSLLSQNYSIKEVNLKEDKPLPDGLKCLVIAKPTEKFTDYELFEIDQQLMRGTNLAIFTDAFNEVMPNQQQRMYGGGPNYIPLNTGLEKLLKHYGVTLKHSYVMDENCYKQRLPAQYGGGERTIYFAPMILNKNINNDLDFLENIKGLIAMKISPLSLDNKIIEDNQLKAEPIFSSSLKSWEMKGRINLNPMMIRPPTAPDEMSQMTLAYLLEGEFPSYFANKPIPEKAVPEKKDEEKGEEVDKTTETAPKKPEVDLSQFESQDVVLKKSHPGKIFIMGSSEMLKDNMLDEEGVSPNAMFILNTLDALNNRSDIAVMRSKVQRFNPLEETTPGAKTFIKTFNIAGLPVVVVFFGFIVLFRRHFRKKQIRMMFHQ